MGTAHLFIPVTARGFCGAILAFLLAGFAVVPALAADKLLVIEDNDFLGPGGSDIQSVLPLIATPGIEILGFTVATGDGWRDEECAYLLKFLEVAGEAKLPVYPGAVFPLLNSRARMLVWEKANGTIPWKGAWNDASMGPRFHPDDPWKLPVFPDGPPKAKPSSESAVTFLIEQVHKYPHQVTILEAGPMTNLALAIRQDPSFAGLAKELVFMGAIMDANLGTVTGDADFNTDFNLIFDPEAAHITLTADWPRITAVGNVSNDTLMTQDLVDQVAAKNTRIARYLAQNADKNLPLWDELAAEIVVDPTLVTKSVDANMDVITDHGTAYGQAHVWPDAITPHQGERKVRIVLAVDRPRFVAQFLKAAEFGPR
jgi:inosine-uridine nucleoside N-ribohydrolase